MMENQKCVHTEHCCRIHGCKYGDKNCPVWLGFKTQSFSCEYCDDYTELYGRNHVSKDGIMPVSEAEFKGRIMESESDDFKMDDYSNLNYYDYYENYNDRSYYDYDYDYDPHYDEDRPY